MDLELSASPENQPGRSSLAKLPSGPQGLSARNFQKISHNGFGDQYNAYPHSMIWYKDHLYVGTTRANLHLMWFTMKEWVDRFAAWPVERPANPFDLDLRAQIWRYYPPTDTWEQVYISPMLMGSEGFEVPLSIGFRGITLYQGKHDPEPVIYCTTWGTSKGPGPVLLRCADGRHFEQVGEPGLGDPTVSTIRAVVPFDGKLFVSPTGTTKGKYMANVPDRMVILVSEDLEAGTWQLACEPFFGDLNNSGIFDLAVFNGYLYASTSNSSEGFQIWKTDGQGKPPYTWRKVITRGGYRGKENQGVCHLFEFQGALYIGSGILGGHDREHQIGPASPELIRLFPDDSWELIVGDPRLTPEGLRVPRSGFRSGYNSPTVGYFWRMCEYEGHLYLGTYDWSVWAPYVRPEALPEGLRKRIERVSVDTIVKLLSGFDLWRSADGVNWVPVTRNGFGNPFNFGLRTMAASPHGLFLGVANPFGPTMAVKRLAGWKYEHNQEGGCEVWLGSRDFPDDKAPFQGELVPYELVGRRTVPELAVEMAATLYEDSGFGHCGFWNYSVKTLKEACENLVKEIVALLPDQPASLLEIGCKEGATTKMIASHFPAAAITGVVDTVEELAACQARVPGGVFHLGQALKRKSLQGSFDAAVCIEGPSVAPKFRKFFQTMNSALRLGGTLVFADIIAADEREGPGNLAEYESMLSRSGFKDIQLWDVTNQCWKGFLGHTINALWAKLLAGKISQELYDEILKRLPTRNRPVKLYVIGRAQKNEHIPQRKWWL
jgi:SAM-dependent methyltransferase